MPPKPTPTPAKGRTRTRSQGRTGRGKLPAGRPRDPTTLETAGHRAARPNAPAMVEGSTTAGKPSPGRVKKDVPREPSAEDPLPIDEMVTDNRFAEIGSVSTKEPEGSVGSSRSTMKTTEEMTSLRTGLTTTNEVVAGLSDKVGDMASTMKDMKEILAVLAARKEGSVTQSKKGPAEAPTDSGTTSRSQARASRRLMSGSSVRDTESGARSAVARKSRGTTRAPGSKQREEKSVETRASLETRATYKEAALARAAAWSHEKKSK